MPELVRRDRMEKEILTGTTEFAAEVDRDLMERWLTFWLDGQRYAISVAHVEGIVRMLPITSVPEYPPYAKGVIDLRGTVIPVLDLRLRFGKREAEYTDATCIINCRVEENNIGLIVDEVDAVISITPDMISTPPRMEADPAKRYLTGIARVSGDADSGDKIILCLDATHILQTNEIRELIKE